MPELEPQPIPEDKIVIDAKLRREFILLIKLEVTFEKYRIAEARLKDVDDVVDQLRDFRAGLESD